ncbi:TIM-barrel domain-containing protein [Candidatus Clostridium radicumherbarum]|uniref:TIM-barrel domain-containing protein n=1 Tax=Candidatus Clostridium radicumherbarum TaxID=3381662 RepID=A0ABW8TM90_9CLOT
MNTKVRLKKLICYSLSILMLLGASVSKASAAETTSGNADLKTIGKVSSITQSENKVNIKLETGEDLRITFLTEDVLRVNMEPSGNFLENPVPNSSDHTTTILAKSEADYEKENKVNVSVATTDSNYIISTGKVELKIEKENSKMQLVNKASNKVLWSEAEPLKYGTSKTVQTLSTNDNEYFYGGGQQNGYFSHKGTVVDIVNENNWADGGASSPSPFYVSTGGYGVMRHTWKPGKYDFGATSKDIVTTVHNEARFDAYYFAGGSIPAVLNEYTELTGKPALLPQYAFYLGHADAFNRDMVGPPGNQHRESLNVEGRAALDSYGSNGMPLGWFLPNDGYGCGYGQTDTLDGNIANLKSFVDYSNSKGVQVGLWTQSNIHPLDPNNPTVNDRDIDKEVGVAGTRGVKTDVAWVGAGYSFGLNAVRQAYEGIQNNSNYRPFVISLDGWSGTQRYAGLWSGDQTGGDWEYIRMHIPTYIGAGLSGNPNVGSDMDGIFGGKNPAVQTRDFQWKAFTPIQIDMDGWGSNAKNPWVFGEPYTSINRMYLNLKAQMLPYYYTYAAESSKTGMPMVRAMVLEYPNDPFTYGKQTQYQYMWGKNLLVAPMYRGDENNAGIRNGIYLPDKNQVWIDYFTGDQYKGGVVLNNFSTPIWKLPLFVKNGAIIPMTTENTSPSKIAKDADRIFEVYPSGNTDFSMYEDDGYSQNYKNGVYAATKITSSAPVTGKGQAVITVDKAVVNSGDYASLGLDKQRGTQFIVNVQEKPESLQVKVGGTEVQLTEVTSEADFNAASGNVYFYNEKPNLNKYASAGSDFANTEITTTPKLYVKVAKTDVTANSVELTVNGFNNTQAVKDDGAIAPPAVPVGLGSSDAAITDSQIKLTWNAVEGAKTYDIRIGGENGYIVSNLKDTSYIHEGLPSDTEYTYEVRAVNSKGTSDWSQVYTARTKLDRYRNVVKNISITCSASDQPGTPIQNAVDGDDTTLWHTTWGISQTPMSVTMDLKAVYDIDKFEYTPRTDAGNGTITKYDFSYSVDGKSWKTAITDGTWVRSKDVKTIQLDKPVKARYLKLYIKQAVGGFGSGIEFRPYKVDGSTAYPAGDYNSDNKVDEGDLTFLKNYMGIKEGDADWNYASRADVNYNGIIDGYDLAFVTGQLDGGVVAGNTNVSGNMILIPSKTDLKAGDEFAVKVYANNFNDVNAFSMEIPLDTTKYVLTTGSTKDVLISDLDKEMLNYSTVLAKDNKTRINLAFANLGNKAKITGNGVVATLKLRAVADIKFDMAASNAVVVNSDFDSKDGIGIVEANDAGFPAIPSSVVKVPRNIISVGGLTDEDGQKLQGGPSAFNSLIDGKQGTYMELMWIFDTTPVESYKYLPLNMKFTFSSPQKITNFTIRKRPNGNGSMKTIVAKGYLNGVETIIGTKVAGQADSSLTFENVNATFDTIVLTATDSYPPLYNGKYYMLTIDEVEFYTNNGISVSGIQFDSNNQPSLTAGSIVPFKANVQPSNALNKYYSLASSDESLVKVIRVRDADNSINYLLQTLVGSNINKTVKITATSADGGLTTEKEENIIPTNESVQVTLEKAELVTGGVTKAAVTIINGDKNDTRINWSSSNTKVATVDKLGNITATGIGNTDIIATTMDGVSGEVALRVKPKLVSVNLTADKTSLERNISTQLVVTPKLDDGTIVDLKNTTVEYFTSNPTVAAVDKNTGVITGGNVGTAEVSVKVTFEGITVESNKITVKVDTSIASIERMISSYTTSGDLVGPLVSQLTNNLAQAKHFTEQGKTNEAITHMEDFIKHLNNPPMDSRISDTAKNILNLDSKALVDKWSR